jgi:hypothetical protein
MESDAVRKCSVHGNDFLYKCPECRFFAEAFAGLADTSTGTETGKATALEVAVRNLTKANAILEQRLASAEAELADYQLERIPLVRHSDEKWERINAALQARVSALTDALKRIKLASRMPPRVLGTDSNGDCTLRGCECSNHIACAALNPTQPAEPVEAEVVESAGEGE